VSSAPFRRFHHLSCVLVNRQILVVAVLLDRPGGVKVRLIVVTSTVSSLSPLLCSVVTAVTHSGCTTVRRRGGGHGCGGGVMVVTMMMMMLVIAACAVRCQLQHVHGPLSARQVRCRR
jgi:hypothetical protein